MSLNIIPNPSSSSRLFSILLDRSSLYHMTSRSCAYFLSLFCYRLIIIILNPNPSPSLSTFSFYNMLLLLLPSPSAFPIPISPELVSTAFHILPDISSFLLLLFSNLFQDCGMLAMASPKSPSTSILLLCQYLSSLYVPDSIY